MKASAYGCTRQFAEHVPAVQSDSKNDCTSRRWTDGGAGAVSSVNPSSGAVTRFNETGGVAVGDNAGAFATGFSTGPDARWVTFDNSTGTVTVQMDQRVDPGSVDRTVPLRVLPGGHWQRLLRAAVQHGHGHHRPPELGCGGEQRAVPVAGRPDVLAYGCSTIHGAVDRRLAGRPRRSAAYTFSGDFQFSHQGTVRQVISPTASATAFLDPAKGKSKSKSKAHKAKKHHRKAHRR